MTKTTLLVDNTTFAAAGRVFYHRQRSGEGARHARAYYSRFRDAKALDFQSTAELLTALVLFDELAWDAASASGEAPERVRDDLWLYRWFPLFSKAHLDGILQEFEERYVSGERLDLARQLALRWVAEQVVTGRHRLPRTFRVPLAYLADDYVEREAFEELNQEHDFPLSDEHLAIAMFLHRGLYYQSYTYGATAWATEEGWSYLPHAHRACLLETPSWNLLATICNDQTLWTGSMNKLEITAPQLVEELDQRFFAALDKAVKIAPLPGGVALGAAFMQDRAGDPAGWLAEALEFRESRPGRQVRDFFRELVALGRASNKQAIEDRLGDLDRLLKDAARSRFGTSWVPDRNAGFLLGFLGGWKDLLRVVLESVPRRAREALTRVLYSGVHEHGFQLLFKSYL